MYAWRSIVCGILGMGIVAACDVELGTESVPVEPVPVAEPAAEPAAPVKPRISATVIDGNRLNHFLVVPDSGDIGEPLPDGTAYLIRSQATDRVAVGDGDGVLVRVPVETAAQLAGRRVKVTVSVRSTPTDGSPLVKIMYFRPGSERGSNWQDFPLTSEFAPVTFEYDVPATESSTGVDNIGFWADPEGLGRGVEVSAVYVETID